MKAGWLTNPLEEVCNVEYGTRVVRRRDGGSGFPVYGGGGVTFQMTEFNREDRLVIARFGMSEECTRFVSGRFFLNDSGLTVSPKAHGLLPRFLDYQMLFLNDAIYALGKGSAQKNLDVPAFRSLPVVVPHELPEQQRIVAVLDEAFAAIATARANAEQNLRNAQWVLRAHLNSVFEERDELWSEGVLSDIATFTSGLWKGEKPPFVHVGVIRNTNFTKDGLLDDTDIAFLDVEVRQFKKRRLQPGDIILEKSGGGPKQAVGRVVLFDKTGGDFSLSNFTSAIRIKNPAALDAKYLHLYLHWLYLSGATESMQSHSTGIRNLNGDGYRAIRVRYPGRQEQERIADLADQLFKQTRRLSDLVNEKLVALDALKQSLLHQAFTGAL